jgi:hypothetical protein
VPEATFTLPMEAQLAEPPEPEPQDMATFR